jgi:uroporphyrinogen-III synthase
VAEAILEQIGNVAGQRILLPRADIARETLAQGLRDHGAIVDEVTAYRTVTTDATHPLAQQIRTLLEHDEIDVITFTSSSTVRGLVAALNHKSEIINLKSKIACIGPITAQTARELGLRVDVIAEEYTIQGLINVLTAFYRG